MDFFNRDPQGSGTKYYEIQIDDPELTQYGFSRFELPTNGNTTKMILDNTKDKALITYIDFDRTSLDHSLKILEEKLLAENKIDQHRVKDLVAFFRNACLCKIDDKDPDFVFFTNGNGNAKGNAKTKNRRPKGSDSHDGKKEIFLQKYTMVGNCIAEAIIVGARPKFAVPIPKVGYPDQISSIRLYDSIDLDEDTIIKPFPLTAYINRPYIFKSEEEFQESVENLKTKDLDVLYKKVKFIWKKYVDADDFHISICAADTIFTYFQDRIGVTHYLFFIGGNNSGKSNNLPVLHFLSYRSMMSSGMTAANVYTYLGSGEEVMGTICEDEADNIDQDFDKMKVYKNGYTTGRPYLRTDTSVGRQQNKFNTFCFKAFAAEKLPDSVTAKGFNQRIIELPCVYGFPAFDISELVNPAGDEEFQHLLDELNTMRNALLVYRLLHFHEKMPNIKLNIQNREKQLFKPILRVFQHTKTLNELLPVISKYVGQKRESDANTLHAFLYELVKDLVKAQNTYELQSSLIWNTIKETLNGKEIPYKPQSYDTVEFGVISQKGIIEILVQVFGAKHSDSRREKRKLVFDQAKLQRLGKIYELSVDVKVGTSSAAVTDVTDVTDVGLDKHILGQVGDREFPASRHENTNISDKELDQNEKIAAKKDQKVSQSCIDPSQASQASPKQKHNASFSFGKWHCSDCKASGDRFHMENTDCKGVAK